MLIRTFLVLFLLFLPATAQEPEELVKLNTQSLKYHCVTCKSAKDCTRNCVEVTVSEAKERGGVPCKLCGGTCKAK